MFRRKLSAPVFVALFAAVVMAAPPAEKKAPTFDVKDLKFNVSGPHVHDNMTVFLLHAKDQDAREFLTLDKGLDQKLVTVSEKAQEQVGELLIENKSDKHLFLQEGDRIQGGKQDRIIVTSLVIPPKSGPMPLPTFCCEQGRWTLGSSGKGFMNASNTILAPQGVRAAAKYTPGMGGQGRVWDEVARSKGEASAKLSAPNTNTTLNETLDSKQVKKLCDDCARALGDLPAKHADAIGVAIAVNGKVEEINVYPNAAVLRAIYPRLVQSYALQAALVKDQLKGKPAPAVAAEAVEKFMAGKEKEKRFEGINPDNGIRVRDLTTEFECVTAFKGQALHRQWLPKAAVPEAPKGGGRQGQQPPPRN